MVAACAASALLLAYTGVCQAYIGRNWTEPKRWERRISCSPHLELATSCLEELTKPESWTLTMNTGAYDDVDFVSRERDPSAPPALTLPDLQLAGPRPRTWWSSSANRWRANISACTAILSRPPRT